MSSNDFTLESKRVKELGINNVNINNPTYIPIDDSFETIMKNHNQFITSVGLEISEEDQNLPYLYWTPKLHKSPYKHRFIAGSSNVSVNSNWVHPPPGNPRGLAQKHCPGGRDLTFDSCPGAGNSTRAGILWKFKVKHFVRVYWFYQ